MGRLGASLIAMITLAIIAFVLGCMEPEAQTEDEGASGNAGTGIESVPVRSPPMDVEITNIAYEWHEYPDQPLASPDLRVTCDAINYGGSGYVTIKLVANATNASVCMEQRIKLEQNEQRTLNFYGKLPQRPTSIQGSTMREVLSIVQPPASGDPDVEVVNVYYDVLGWLDPDRTQLQISIYATAINYGPAGYVTVTADVWCQETTKRAEQRIHLGWNEQAEIRIDAIVPSMPVNVTAYPRRPQGDK